MNQLKITYIFLLICIVAIPSITIAAFNDVTLVTDADISVNSITLDVSGSNAVVESIVVNSTDFTVTLQEGSTFTVTSSARSKFVVDSPAPVQVTRPCTSTESSLTLQGGSDVTVTITPSSDACDASTTTTTSSSGGGGGSASAPGVVTTTSTQTTAQTTEETEAVSSDESQEVAQISTETSSSSLTQGQVGAIIDLLEAFGAEQSVIDNVMLSLSGSGSSESGSSAVAKPLNVSAVFTAGLARGDSNSDVKRLQQLLNLDPDTVVAVNGAGSAGNETNYFGSLTENAVQKFQMKYSVVSSSIDPGYGYVGPKTRAKLAEVFGQ